MDKTTATTVATREQMKTSWQENRMEIEQQWHSALYNEDSAIVPSKLPISLPPVRHAA